MELIRNIVKVGNSAGVILPREWLNGKARIELFEKPIDIKKDIFEILEPYLEDIIGIYLVGSYARGDETPRSDIDVLAITNKTSKRIEKGKYSVTITTKENVEETLENNALIILPMLKEAKSLLNAVLIEKYKETELTKKNLKGYLELTQSALKINKEFIELGTEKVGDAIAYSLILNLRNTYIIKCIRENKLWSNKQLQNLIKKIAGSLEAYEGYLRVKENKHSQDRLLALEARKLYEYISKKVGEHEQWLKARKE